MYFPQDEFEARWRHTYAEMARRGIDCALIWAQTGWTYHRAVDVMYPTNFHSPHEPEFDSAMWAGRSYSAMILKDREEPDLHADAIDPRPELIATSRATGHDDVIAGVAQGLKARRIEGKVALVGGDVLPLNPYRRLDDLTPGIEFEITDDLMLAVRRIKSPRELDCGREGGAMWPFYGHGGMWEQPLIHVDPCGAEDVFETGMVASSETFLYREGGGGAAIEQNDIVHDDHVEVVTDSPMFWW